MPNSQSAEDFELTEAQQESSPELRWVNGFTRTLDTKLRIPGTSIRFGLDFLLGLVPGIGDFVSLTLSGLLIATMAKNGASASLVLKMLGNVLIDAVVGAVPILGNLFDLFFKANTRNLALMREYYDQDRHRGSVWPVLMIVAAAMALMGVLVIGTIGVLVRIFLSSNAA